MATKSITIDVEAYERLRSVRKDHESFSQTIKRVVPEPFDVDAWLEDMRAAELSKEAIEAVEERLRQRRGDSERRAAG